jgi:hypothetical protein
MIIKLEKKMKIKVDWNGKDDNNGFIYGIEHQDENENVIDIEWFKTEEERNRRINCEIF